MDQWLKTGSVRKRKLTETTNEVPCTSFDTDWTNNTTPQQDALALQKSVQDRRHKGDNMSKVQTWVSHELEVLVSTVAAERSLEELVEDRAIINSQLNQLKQQVQSGNLSKDELAGIKEEMKQLGEDLDLRSAQIADLQQKIDDSDQENKTKTRWDTLQSMGEAKIALVYLFDVAAEVKRDVASKTHKLAEIEEALKRAEEKLAQDELELREVMSNHKEEIHRLEKEHQNKLFLLLRQLNGSGAGGDTALLERIKILEAELEHMEELQRLLEEQRTEVDKLRDLLDQRTAELEQMKQTTPNKNNKLKNKAKSAGKTLSPERVWVGNKSSLLFQQVLLAQSLLETVIFFVL
uniref:Uncharacterized protein n=1 Tax=Timema monikensis TaxID=170555 RepID=A0A7R9HJK6_9NEOP|nr:unnamed protein product [Timema monikensis]